MQYLIAAIFEMIIQAMQFRELYIFSLCCYNVVQYDMLLHTALQWWRQNLDKELELYKTPHTLPLQVSYRVSVMWIFKTLQWHYKEHDGVSHHQLLDCLLNCLFRSRSRLTSKLCITGICEGDLSVTSGFPSQRSSKVENIYIYWRHQSDHITIIPCCSMNAIIWVNNINS